MRFLIYRVGWLDSQRTAWAQQPCDIVDAATEIEAVRQSHASHDSRLHSLYAVAEADADVVDVDQVRGETWMRGWD